MHNSLQHVFSCMKMENDHLEASPQTQKDAQDIQKMCDYFLTPLKKQSSKKKTSNKVARKDYDIQRQRNLPPVEVKKEAVKQAMLMLATLVDVFKCRKKLKETERFVLNVLMVDGPLGATAILGHSLCGPFAPMGLVIVQ